MDLHSVAELRATFRNRLETVVRVMRKPLGRKLGLRHFLQPVGIVFTARLCYDELQITLVVRILDVHRTLRNSSLAPLRMPQLARSSMRVTTITTSPELQMNRGPGNVPFIPSSSRCRADQRQ